MGCICELFVGNPSLGRVIDVIQYCEKMVGVMLEVEINSKCGRNGAIDRWQVESGQ